MSFKPAAVICLASLAVIAGCAPDGSFSSSGGESASSAAAPQIVASLVGRAFVAVSGPDGSAPTEGGVSFERGSDDDAVIVTTVRDGGAFAVRDAITRGRAGDGAFALHRVTTRGETREGRVTQSGPDSWVVEEETPAGADYDRARDVYTLKGDHLIRFSETSTDGVRTVGETYVYVASPNARLPAARGLPPIG